MSISDKIKAMNNKTKQKKAQHDLDWQTDNNPDLSSRNFSKYKFLTGKDV